MNTILFMNETKYERIKPEFHEFHRPSTSQRFLGVMQHMCHCIHANLRMRVCKKTRVETTADNSNKQYPQPPNPSSRAFT